MLFFDTHTHFHQILCALPKHSIKELLTCATKQQVKKILILAVKPADFNDIKQLCLHHQPQLIYGLGLHPWYIEQYHKNDLDLLQQQFTPQHALNLCVAVGEIGLDRGKPNLVSPAVWHKQLFFLEAQLQLAKQFQLPVSLHSYKAHDSLAVLLKQANLPRKGVIHGFSGSWVQAKRFVDLGFKIGVGGTITYPRAQKTRRVIAQLPLESLILETDSPYMPINGFQGQVNRPDLIIHIFHHLCQLRPEPTQTIVQQLWQTSCQLFNPSLVSLE